ncbi:hypothetical protein EJ08DRAFT_685832 [Tothia fuscella]|uniref:HECT-type E3 ubiquitin transferase n=1 Tax=Tothia fuscella TaxID=1048955 RepID=A0A9P4U198_9PEZI|nr:hypothetical protein EJ08DRAFT_685832 [Tothia fuscella]
MFQTFSGSSRKPRQVNLSGRRTDASAVKAAQQERENRQKERDRLKAAKLAQRLWRGHHTRSLIRQEWRDEWDSEEEAIMEDAYPSQNIALQQLQRLVHFVRLQDGEDVERLRKYVKRLRLSLQNSDIICAGGPWPMAYLRLRKLVLTAIPNAEGDLLFELETLAFIGKQIPECAADGVKTLYRTMAGVVHQACTKGELDKLLMGLVLRILTAPLQTFTASSLKIYEAFACEFLTLADITESPFHPNWLDALAERVNYKLLASALSPLVSTEDFHGFTRMKDGKNRLTLLGCFIYFHRHAHQFKNAQAYSSHKDFVHVISALLSSVANDVDLDDLEDAKLIKNKKGRLLNPFAQEQIISLVNQESIGSLLWGASNSSSRPVSPHKMNSEAKQLANYALTLLRFFPRRADEIRMWLYMGSTSADSATKTPAIKFFWQAARNCMVFNNISRDSGSAVRLLKLQPSRDGNSTNHAHMIWVQDNWRVILVFLELYTFVLKLMDDEEFFSGSSAESLSSEGSWARQNALALDDIKDLTVFLKNLGFTMYFHAKEIVEEQQPHSEVATLSSYFKVDVEWEEFPSLPKTPETAIAGLSGISIDYVKGLVTGLLRMLHERDSRRKFLPKDHWLMTTHFDMTSFIPDVVAEDENMHRIQEEDDEDIEPAGDDSTLEDTNLHFVGTARDRSIRYHERLERQQRKASRKRYLQTVAPRSEILQNMPFFIPFNTRVHIFREFVRRDQAKRRHGLVDAELWRINMMNTFDASGHNNLARHTATIRRKHEFEDAYDQFYQLKEGLKEPIQITFMDQFGGQEAGIDGGGVTKEFLTSVTSQAFSPSEHLDLFIENEQHLLFPNPAAVEEQKEVLYQMGLTERDQHFRDTLKDLSQRYEFLGRIIGKCLYEGILVDINFAGFFLLKWALFGGANAAARESNYRANLNDLRDLDEDLYKGLIQLKNYTGNVEDFSLNFTVSDEIRTNIATGAVKTITSELKPNGAQEAVTNSNRLVYISYIARYRLALQPRIQTQAFLQGLSSMIAPHWLAMFNQSELQTLIGGTSSSIDVSDLRRNTEYGGLYSIGDDGLEHPTIQLFWSVLESLTDKERRAVLKFVTSTPRAPLLGFGSLNPKFSIRDSSADEARLPSTSTCVNLLKLPRYKSEGLLKEKLLYAVFSGAGFDLS